MIKNWLVRGDTHRNFTWMLNGCLEEYAPKETAIIILGDAGFDFYLDESDEKVKEKVNKRNYFIYWLRGNHEARPQDVDGYTIIYDDNVNGYVYCNPKYPYLRVFMDYGIYKCGKYSIAIISGAYSVDKNWRLNRVGLTEENNDPKISSWFNNEQLTSQEMDEAAKLFKNKTVDFVFSHTCPYSWRPVDKFLSFIDQSTVDNTMEKWLDQIKETFNWNVWCFGHFHTDRIELPHVEQYFNDIEELDTIVKRWNKYDTHKEIDWWLNKSPKFYF